MKIQELDQKGQPRKGVPPITVSKQQWERMQQTVIGRKRFKEVKPPKSKPTEDK